MGFTKTTCYGTFPKAEVLVPSTGPSDTCKRKWQSICTALRSLESVPLVLFKVTLYFVVSCSSSTLSAIAPAIR